MGIQVRILVVDDDEVDRFAIQRSLAKSEWTAQTTIATTAAEARSILATEDFDCVFMDYLLPDSDGITLLRTVRASGYSNPVVVVTSQGDEILAADAIKSGASDYISKRMLTTEGINQVMRNVMRMHASEIARKEAETALRESEARLAETQRIGEIGGWELKLPDEPVYWSPQLFQLLGFEPDEFVPSFTKYLELLLPDDRKKAYGGFLHSIQTGLPFRVDVKFRDKHGNLRDIEIHGRPLHRDASGNVSHLIGTLQDVTERKRIEAELRIAKEAAEQAARARQEFLANMSHEIRTPLNSILGFAHLLEESPLNEEQRDFLHAINISGKALLEIINDILDLSKMEAGKLVMRQGFFDVRKLVEETVAIFKPSLKEKNLELKLSIAGQLPPLVWGDEGRLRQVLLNLLSNAIKFTQKGWVSLRVSIASVEEAQVRLRFEVQDTGIGIPLERQEAIFERFMQADVATSRAFGGSGLGLTISKRIVELQGGTMGVESNPTWGSTFWFEVPYGSTQPVELPATTPQASALPIEGHPDSLTILVAEDNQLSQALVRKILEQAGFRVVTCGNGMELLRNLQDIHPSLVLMDVQMPELDGRQATRIVRTEMPPGLRGIPVLGMTAHAVEEELVSCLEAGMNDYIVKPISAPELLAKISALMALPASSHAPYALERGTRFKVIQPYKLHEVTGEDPAMERELIKLFRRECGESLERMKASIANCDWEGLYKAAHFIKPSFYLFGVEEAREIFPSLEKHAKGSQSAEEIGKLMRRLDGLQAEVLMELDQYLIQLG